MLTEQEVKVLELLSSRLLAKVEEIKSGLGDDSNGVTTAIQRLISIDCVKTIEPIGERCFVITQKGTRVLSDMKNPEKRAEAAGSLARFDLPRTS